METQRDNNQMSVHLPKANDGRLTNDFFDNWIMDATTTDYNDLNKETFSDKDECIDMEEENFELFFK